MPAYLSRPVDAGKYPGVLLFMEIFGVNRHIRSVADRLATEGFVVLAPEPFHCTARGFFCDERGDCHARSAGDAWRHLLAMFRKKLA